MSGAKWIKLSTAMFDDEKIRLIEQMPEADTIIMIWVRLLIQAGKTNSSGYIFLSDTIPYTDEMLAAIFNRPINTVRLALETFKNFGMIEIDDESFIHIANWEKHQNVEGLERIREQTRKRVQKHRQQKSIESSGVTLQETEGNALDKEVDKDIDKENNRPYATIINHLNEKTGSRFSPKSQAHRKLINGRMAEGREVADFIRVIDVKCAEWLDNPQMNEYLRPSTLFAQKNFENYVNQKPPAEEKADPRDKEIEFQRWVTEGGNPSEFDWST